MSTKRSSAPGNHDRGKARAPRTDNVKDESREARLGQRIVVQDNGCWLWKGRTDQYGRFNGKGFPKGVIVHRFVFEMLVGPIRKGCHIHHVCETKGCCNPEHLRELTPSEHMSLHHELRRGAA